MLLDTSLLCDTALARFWPTLTPDSHKRSLAVAHGGKRDFDLTPMVVAFQSKYMCYELVLYLWLSQNSGHVGNLIFQ